MVPGFSIAARTKTRDELLTAAGTLHAAALVIDIDDPNAVSLIIAAREVRPRMATVGITKGTDLKHVIAAQRAGCTHISTRPLDPNDLVVALRHAINQTGDVSQDSETIGVIGAVGGAGTTTIACHLVTELAQLGQSSAALFDLDLEFGGAARAFDVAPKFTLADLVTTSTADASLLERAAVKLSSGPHIFSRPPTIVSAHTIDDQVVRNTLRMATRVYRYIVLDLPRKLDALTGAAIEQCGKVLLVLQLTVPSIDNAKRFIDALTAEGFAHERIELVVNRFRKNVSNCTIDLVESQLGQTALGVVPNDYETVNKAIDVGQALSQKSPVRCAIREIAAKLAGQEEPTKRRTWLSKVGLGR